MKKRMLKFLISGLMLSCVTLFLLAQNAPVLDQGYAGAAMVSGKVSPGQGTVTIYDTSNQARIFLGTSQSIDSSGKFAVAINSPLILGHSIVVVDQNGATSPAMVVAARPSSPSHH